MAQPKAAQASDASQLTEYAQAVILLLKKLGVLTIAITIPVTAFLTTRYDVQQAEIYLLDSERTATLKVIPERSTVIKGEWFKIKVKIDTGGSQLTEARAVLGYDQDKIKIERINFADYARNNHLAIDNNQGRTEVRSFFNTQVPGYFTGNETWFEVTISTHKEGLASFWFDCRRGAEDETNLLRFGGGDIVDCNKIGQGWFTVDLVDRSAVISDQDYVCSRTAPAVPANLTVVSGPGRGEATLGWNKVNGATHYTVTYGTESGNYQYGSPNIGDTSRFTIRGLVPGQVYYFVITAVNLCASSGYTSQVSALAGYGTITSDDYDPSPEKGFQPPLPPKFLPEEEELEESTSSAEATASALRQPLEKPSPSAPPQSSPAPIVDTQEPPSLKPWQRLDFWLLALGTALGGLFLIFVGSLLGRGERKEETSPLPPPGTFEEEAAFPGQSTWSPKEEEI